MIYVTPYVIWFFCLLVEGLDSCVRLRIYGFLDGSVWFQWSGWIWDNMILLVPMVCMVPIENLTLYYSILEHRGMCLEVVIFGFGAYMVTLYIS
jgi:hypothetical protein